METRSSSGCELAEEFDIYANKMKNTADEHFRPPKLVLLSEFEYFYGNEELIKISYSTLLRVSVVSRKVM